MTTAMAACASQGHITSRASTASLDLKAILSSYVAESLLSTRLSFSSTSSSLQSFQSFDAIPPCPAQRKPRLFVNDLGLAGLPSAAQHTPATPLHSGDGSHSLVLSATASHPKVILMEKASIHSWVVSGVPLPDGVQFEADTEPQTSHNSHPDHLNGAFHREPVKGSDPSPCGHSTSPDPFQYTQRSPHTRASPTVPGLPPAKSRPDMALRNLSKVTDASLNSVTCTSVSRLGDSTVGAQPKDGPSALLLVPTIMVSNSTAALALSLESSTNLHSHQDVPLAIRRGKKPPPALTLEQPGKPSTPESADSNSYPDIPSAFLGSSPTSPSFNGVNIAAGKPSKFDMGLSTMCTNLKALVPPPPFTPTEPEHQPPSHPPPSLEPETQWGMATAAQLPDANDEEWRFVQDLIVEWHETKGRSAKACPPASPPPHTVAYTGIEAPIMDASGKGSPPPTSTGSRTDDNKPNLDVQQPSTQSSPSVKQSRRKTVIIQAPDGDIQIAPGNAERPAKSGKLCSPSGERSIDFLLDEFDEPVPFEIPSSVPLSAPASLEGSFCTPPSSRPASTASSAGLPIRGILKEKKSVRFSAVPSLYEYATAMLDAPADRPGTPSMSKHHHSDLDVLSALKRVPVAASALTWTPSKSSPLRKSQTHTQYSPGSYGPEEVSTANIGAPLHVPSASATMPTTPAPAHTPMTPPRSVPPTCRTWNSPNNASPGTAARVTTMAKHPAVRALAHKPSPTRPPGLQIHSPVVGAGAGGAVVGAPSLQSPYPTMSSPRRTPMRTISANANGRQNAANMVERKPTTVSSSPVKQAQSSPARVGRKEPASLSKYKGKENISHRASHTASPRSSLDHELRRGEALTPNTRRRSAGVLSGTPLKVENACGGASTPAGAGAGAVGSQSRRNSSSSRMPVPLRNIFTKLRTA